MSDRKFMLLSVEKAAQGVRSGQTPFGACIVRKGKIISCAHNVVWKTKDITAHAEIQAIREACQRLKSVDLSGCIIYSTCEPCPMCFSACHWAKISKIVYGTSIADAKSAGFNELSVSNFRMKRLGKSPLEIRGGFMRRENLALFRAWSALKNRKVY